MQARIRTSVRKSIELLVGSMMVFTATACSDGSPEEGTLETSVSSLVVPYEAESLSRTASATGSQVTSESGASAGQYVQLSGTPPSGSWLQFTLPNVTAGTYD